METVGYIKNNRSTNKIKKMNMNNELGIEKIYVLLFHINLFYILILL